MDYRKWAEMQQIPSNPNPSADLYAQIYNARHSSSYAHHPYYSHQTRNPSLEDPRTVLKRLETPSSLYEAGLEAGLRRPGIDSYAAINSYPSSLAGLKGHEALTYGHQAAQISPLSAASYYHDTGAVAQKWAAKEAIRQFGADPAGFVAAGIRSANGTEPLLAANPNPLPRSNAKIRRPPFNKASRRGPKKTKVVQSAWCEICKIDCNSKDVLDQHKLGKKHKKNLERLEGSKEEASAPGAAAAPVVKNLSIGPKENQAADKGKNVCMLQTKKKVASSSPGDDLETKKRRIMLGSVTANDVRVCTICNVVCNSETVFSHHIAGQKHANMVKKQAAEAATPGP